MAGDLPMPKVCSTWYAGQEDVPNDKVMGSKFSAGAKKKRRCGRAAR